jgi:hypothetical protein
MQQAQAAAAVASNIGALTYLLAALAGFPELARGQPLPCRMQHIGHSAWLGTLVLGNTMNAGVNPQQFSSEANTHRPPPAALPCSQRGVNHYRAACNTSATLLGLAHWCWVISCMLVSTLNNPAQNQTHTGHHPPPCPAVNRGSTTIEPHAAHRTLCLARHTGAE